MRIVADGLKKIEKSDPPSARFSVCLEHDGAEFYLTGFRVVGGRIWPPAYMSGRRAYPITISNDKVRGWLWAVVKKLKLPEGVPPLHEDWDTATELLKADPMSLAKMFPAGLKNEED